MKTNGNEQIVQSKNLLRTYFYDTTRVDLDA